MIDIPFVRELRHQFFFNKDAKSKALSFLHGGQLESAIEILSHAAGYQRIVCVLTVRNEGAVKLDIGQPAPWRLAYGASRVLDRNAREGDKCI